MNIFSIFKLNKNKEKQCYDCPYAIQYKKTVTDLSEKWHDIIETTKVPISGKYVILCKGDNRTLYEIREYLVDDLFVNQFKETYDGYALIKPFKYLYIQNL